MYYQLGNKMEKRVEITLRSVLFFILLLLISTFMISWVTGNPPRIQYWVAESFTLLAFYYLARYDLLIGQ